MTTDYRLRTPDSRLQTSFVTCTNAIPPSNNYEKNSCRTQYYRGCFVPAFLFGALYQARQFMGDRSVGSCLPRFISSTHRVYFSMANT